MIAGLSVTDAALEAGIRRETLSGWIHHNVTFQAYLNQRRREVLDERRCALVELIREVEDAVQRALRHPDISPNAVLQTGLAALPKLYGLLNEQRIGSSDPAELARAATQIDVTQKYFNAGLEDEESATRLLERSAAELESAS